MREALRHIEQVLGRERTDDPDSPRTIDLDLTYYQGVAKDFGDWQLPDPHAETSPHVAIPIADVAPDWEHPVSGATAYDIVAGLDAGEENMRPVNGHHPQHPRTNPARLRIGMAMRRYMPRTWSRSSENSCSRLVRIRIVKVFFAPL